jgi:hypothetical protein
LKAPLNDKYKISIDSDGPFEFMINEKVEMDHYFSDSKVGHNDVDMG